jgi:hypothetical protein
MLIWQYTNLKELFEIVKKDCIKESHFIKGMIAITDNPFVKTLEYLKTSLVNDAKLLLIRKNT